MELDIDKLTVLGLPAIALVMVLVQIAKAFGLPGRFAPVAAVVAGALVAAGMAAIELSPAMEPLVRYLVIAVLLGGAAMGIYSGSKAIQGFQSLPPGTQVVVERASTENAVPMSSIPDRVASNASVASTPIDRKTRLRIVKKPE